MNFRTFRSELHQRMTFEITHCKLLRMGSNPNSSALEIQRYMRRQHSPRGAEATFKLGASMIDLTSVLLRNLAFD